MTIGLLIFGLSAGVLAGFFGIGGGTFIVPMMTLFGLDIKLAVGISVMQMMFSSISASYVNYKNNNLNIKEGLWVGIGGFIGAAFSGLVVNILSSKILEGIFLLLTLVALYRFLVKGNESQLQPRLTPHRLILMLIGGITGIFAISLGIGGGLILVPLLSLYLGISSKRVIPISLFFIIFSSTSGFVSLAYFGYVNYLQGAIVGIASIIGAMIGSYLLNIIDVKKHRYALVLLYAIVIAIMAYEFFKDII
ncbi:hypothetical protein CCZ01_00825 [Helicobacter monodelphidis]|nr:hypothetical protein CCZ01_00825 [Helicobacter sp. 15-1451]